MNKELYNMLKDGMTAEEITKALNEAQKQLDKDRKAEEEKKRAAEVKALELKIAREDLVDSLMVYFERLGVKFNDYEETWEAIYEILEKCEEDGFGLDFGKKDRNKLVDMMLNSWLDF